MADYFKVLLFCRLLWLVITVVRYIAWIKGNNLAGNFKVCVLHDARHTNAQYTQCEFVLSLQLPAISTGHPCMKDNHCVFSIIHQTSTHWSVFLITKWTYMGGELPINWFIYIDSTPSLSEWWLLIRTDS